MAFIKVSKTTLLLIFIFCVAILFRLLPLSHNSLTFGYDQARDAFIAQQIMNGDLKILGPSANAPGMYHGVLYFYYLVPGYFFGHGNPIVVAITNSVFNALTVFIIFHLAYRLTTKKSISLIATLLYAFSHEAIQYAGWLSNPTLAMVTLPLTYLCFLYFHHSQKRKYIFLTGLCLGLSIQAEIFLAYHLLIIIAWHTILKTKTSIKAVILFLLGIFIATSTMIAVEFKFGFQSLHGLKSLLTSTDSLLNAKSFTQLILIFIDQLVTGFKNGIFPFNTGYAGLLLLLLIILSLKLYRKSKDKTILLLLTLIFSHLLILPFGGISTPYITVGLVIPLIILTTYCLYHTLNKLYLFISIFILLSVNLTANMSHLHDGQYIFAIQKDMVLSNQLELIDFTYQQSQNQPFTVSTLTVPLWTNTVWSYLYHWYGQETYDYLPFWQGSDQINYVTKPLPTTTNPPTNHYFIMEPVFNNDPYQVSREQDNQSSFSSLINQKVLKSLEVQHRKRL